LRESGLNAVHLNVARFGCMLRRNLRRFLFWRCRRLLKVRVENLQVMRLRDHAAVAKPLADHMRRERLGELGLPRRPIAHRRTRVVGAFPDGQSALMLVAARLRHVAGTKWGTRRYLDMNRRRDAQTIRTETYRRVPDPSGVDVREPNRARACTFSRPEVPPTEPECGGREPGRVHFLRVPLVSKRSPPCVITSASPGLSVSR